MWVSKCTAHSNKKQAGFCKPAHVEILLEGFRVRILKDHSRSELFNCHLNVNFSTVRQTAYCLAAEWMSSAVLSLNQHTFKWLSSGYWWGYPRNENTFKIKEKNVLGFKFIISRAKFAASSISSLMNQLKDFCQIRCTSSVSYLSDHCLLLPFIYDPENLCFIYFVCIFLVASGVSKYGPYSFF